MTPTTKRDKSTSTNGSLGDEKKIGSFNNPQSRYETPVETPYCLHCDTQGHDIYQCSIPGKRGKINWLQQQDTILEGYRIQRQKRQMVTCLNCYGTEHTTYECGKEGKEKERLIAQLQQQKLILDNCNWQRDRERDHDSDSQKLEAIAVMRRLTNPLGKDWNSPSKSHVESDNA